MPQNRPRLTKQDRAMLAAAIDAADLLLRGHGASGPREMLIHAGKLAGYTTLPQLAALRAKVTP